MNTPIFLSIIFGFLTGICIASFVPISIAHVALGLVIALLCFIVAYLGRLPRTEGLLIGLACICVSLGMLRFLVKDISESKHTLDNFVDQSVEIEGIVEKEVDVRESSQRLLVHASDISLHAVDYPIDQHILVSTDMFPVHEYGDRVRVSGKLSTPENFITDTGKEFDYINYLRNDSIFYTMSFAHVETLDHGEGSRLVAGILYVKHAFLRSIESIIPAPESALMGGLLLGTKQSLGTELQNNFVRTGLVHVIVLSGYNVTIIAEALMKVFSFVSISFGIYFGMLAIVLFAIMTGAGATIIRASIMAILALLARATGRRYDIVRALLLAAALMVFQNPYILVFDISFQLSFLATLGLVFMSPFFMHSFRFLPKRFGLREIVSATIGVQAFVVPFILYKMGNLSLIAPVSNTLVLPLIPTTMFLGFITGLLGLVVPVIAFPFGWVTYLFLHVEIGIVHMFSQLPFASISIVNFPFILVLIFYSVVVWRLYIHTNRYEKV
jgi:competence protein ComEC